MQAAYLESLGLPRRKSGLNSFSLVEVVFALAVISFMLVSLLGLMAYASQQIHQADLYSRLSNVSGQVLATLNSQPYSASTNCATTNAIYYFTYDGLSTNSASGYFQCSVTNATPSSSTWLTNSFMAVRLIIRWPKPQYTNTNILMTSTLNYD